MTDLILPLEKQVSTLESSKILKELGVPQSSLFYWADVSNVKGNPGHKWVILNGNCDKLENYSAFTVAELGELLPGFITKEGRRYFQAFHKNIHHEKEGIVRYSHGFSYKAYWDRCYEDWYYAVCENTEAEARAKMLIYLRKNKLMEVPK